MENETHVHFVEDGSALAAVEIDQPRRSPFISKLHGVFFALGIVVSSYQVRTRGAGIVISRTSQCDSRSRSPLR